MPYWSIAEWRARIGSSWCALGRPVKSKSSFRRVRGWMRRVLTLNQVITMLIMLILLIGMNLILREKVSGEYCCTFTSEWDNNYDSTLICMHGGLFCNNYNSSAIILTMICVFLEACKLARCHINIHYILADLLQSVHVAVTPTLYFLNLGCTLLSALRNCVPLLYQLFPTIIKQSLKQLCSDLMQTLCFGSCILHRLLFLISPLMHPGLWLFLFGKILESPCMLYMV